MVPPIQGVAVADGRAVFAITLELEQTYLHEIQSRMKAKGTIHDIQLEWDHVVQEKPVNGAL